MILFVEMFTNVKSFAIQTFIRVCKFLNEKKLFFFQVSQIYICVGICFFISTKHIFSMWEYIYIIFDNLKRKSKGLEYPIWVFNVNGYRHIINLGLRIHQNSTCRAKNSFYIKIKNIHFFSIIINLFQVVMAIIKFLFGCFYIASDENEIWKKNFFLFFN